MVLPICSRSGDIIEQLLKEQWFADSKKLFKICEISVKDGSLTLLPKNRENLWNHYITAFIEKDWCISRQLWWGQRIPAYKCSIKSKPDESKWFAALNREEAVNKAVAYFKIQEIDLNINQGRFLMAHEFNEFLSYFFLNRRRCF